MAARPDGARSAETEDAGVESSAAVMKTSPTTSVRSLALSGRRRHRAIAIGRGVIQSMYSHGSDSPLNARRPAGRTRLGVHVRVHKSCVRRPATAENAMPVRGLDAQEFVVLPADRHKVLGAPGAQRSARCRPEIRTEPQRGTDAPFPATNLRHVRSSVTCSTVLRRRRGGRRNLGTAARARPAPYRLRKVRNWKVGASSPDRAHGEESGSQRQSDGRETPGAEDCRTHASDARAVQVPAGARKSTFRPAKPEAPAEPCRRSAARRRQTG